MALTVYPLLFIIPFLLIAIPYLIGKAAKVTETCRGRVPVEWRTWSLDDQTFAQRGKRRHCSSHS